MSLAELCRLAAKTSITGKLRQSLEHKDGEQNQTSLGIKGSPTPESQCISELARQVRTRREL